MLLKSCRVAVLALLVGACASPPRPPTPAATAAPQPPRGASVLTIDAQSSELRLLVYKAGTMARLGHNHVILNQALGGWVAVGTAAAFWLEVPTAGFVVDDATARAAEGADFAAPVPEDARAGTLHNMLGEALLDAGRQPTITVQSLKVTDGPNPTATVRIGVAGRAATLSLPFRLTRGDGRLTAEGRVALRQSALGLTPFSVMLGALQVQDEFTLQFRIVALRAP